MQSFVAVGVLVVLCVCVHAQGQRHDVAPVGESRPVIDDVKRLHESVHAQLDTPVRSNINYHFCMTRGCCGWACPVLTLHLSTYPNHPGHASTSLPDGGGPGRNKAATATGKGGPPGL